MWMWIRQPNKFYSRYIIDMVCVMYDGWRWVSECDCVRNGVFISNECECEYIEWKVFGWMESRKKRRFHALSASVSTLVSIWNDPLVHTFGTFRRTHARKPKVICTVADFTSPPNHRIYCWQKILLKRQIKMMIVDNFRVQLVKNQSDLWIRCVLFVLKNVVVKMKRFEHVLPLRCTCDLK